MLEILKILNDKKRKYRKLKIINFLLTIFLTLVGSISIIFLSMFLYKQKIFSFVACIILDLILGSLYSIFSNTIIDNFTNKKKKLLYEINEIEYNLSRILENKKCKDNNIDLRYDNLSRESKLRLLNYIKDNVNEFNIDNINNLTVEEDTIIDDNKNIVIENSGYSRKKKK